MHPRCGSPQPSKLTCVFAAGAYRPCRFPARCAVKPANPLRPIAFVGWLNPFLREGRHKCLATLRRGGGFNVTHFDKIKSFGDWRRVYSKHSVFLNLHQRCGDDALDLAHPFESFRAAHLLGHRAMIISARSHPSDEAEYSGIVLFANLSDVERTYRQLAGRSSEQRASMAEATSAVFRRRFDPEAMFQRAGVFRMLANWGVRRGPRTRRMDGELVSEELFHSGDKLTAWMWKHHA